MANIFDGLEKLSDDDIRLQIAILKNVSLFNTVMETGSRAVNRFISAAGNFLSSLSGSDKNDESDLLNVKIVKVGDRIKQSFNELEKIGRKELDSVLKMELIEKCGMQITEFTDEKSDEAVAVCVVRAAAAAYHLDINQSPSILADTIKEKYYTHMIRVLHIRLIKEDENTRKMTDGACTLVLRKINIERLRELNRELQLAQFNPVSIMAAARADRTPYTLEKIVSVMGFEAFDPIKCIINTVNDGMKSLIKADRLLLANLIWASVSAYGRKLSISRDMLPSFINNGRINGVNEFDIRFAEKLKLEKELERNIKDILSDISENNNRHVVLENELIQAGLEHDAALFEMEDAKKNSDESSDNGRKIKEKFDEYERLHPISDMSNVEYRKLKSEYEQAASRVRVSESRLQRAEKILKRHEKAVLEINEKIAACNRKAAEYGNKLYDCTKEYNDIVFDLDNEVNYRMMLLKKKWEQFFENINFDRNIFESVVKSFNTAELHMLEYSINDINQAYDTAAYAHKVNSNDDGTREYLVYSLVSSGKYAVISYNDKNIMNIYIKDR